ncbi:MAG: STAS/SEC14 domain-containing protein [Acidobacteria bacterium]|nr:STAS/SEC14 domain-containing protein [Acidobacteriota bacterium]
MDILGLRQEVPQDPVGQVLTHEQYGQVAVVDLGKQVSDTLREAWPAQGPFQAAGVIESNWLLPLLGAGSTAASSLVAGNVFMATANPATLMALGTGVGSAVMGSSGIIAQAPFVAVSSALIPVVAPVVLFMTVASAITGARLDRLQRAVGALSESLQRVRHLLEIDDYARFESAAEYLDDVGTQFEHSQRFTDGMKIALVSATRDVKWLRRKFGHLVEREIRSEQDARMVVSDLHLFVLASLVDLRADVLRLHLTLQDDPHYAARREAVLRRKAEQCADTFRVLLERNPLTAFRKRLQKELREVGRFEFLPWGLADAAASMSRTLGGGRGLENTLRTLDTIVDEGFAPVRSRMERWVSEFEASAAVAREESIVFYREWDSQRTLRAYHTRDLRLQRMPA